jgi:flavin-dependent dehydrogenase
MVNGIESFSLPEGRQRVAVIGASTSGLYTASLLAEQGHRVRVYEASGTFRPEPRTLIVTSRLSGVLGFVPEEAVVNEVDRFKLVSRGSSAEVRLRQPDLIVERERMLGVLAERAQRAGAEMVFGRELVGIDRDHGGSQDPLRLRFVGDASAEPLHEEADVVVGADGVHSRAAMAGAKRRRASVALLQALVELPADGDPRAVEVWFDRETTRFFYWLIPGPDGQAAAGLIADDAAGAKAGLDSFLRKRGLVPLGFQSSPVAVHRYVSRPWAELGGSQILLVGDAAGQVKMTTVGGLVTGLRGGHAAAEAILSRGDYRQQLHGLKRELDLHLLLRRILDRFSDDDYDLLLDLLNPGVKALLETWNRDELVRAFWRLPLAQPRLLVLAARVLVRRP